MSKLSRLQALHARTLNRFQSDEKGTIAMLFGLSLSAVFMFAGAGLDFGRAHHAASRAASAIDSGVLAAAQAMRKDPSKTDAQLLVIAQQYFDANIRNAGVGQTTFTKVTFNPPPNRSTGTVVGSVAGHLETYFVRVVGPAYKTIDFTRNSKVAFGLTDIELGVMLDVTGSMSQFNKIGDMKVAVANLANKILDPNRLGSAKMGLAPFSGAVNVGPYASVASGGPSLR